MKANSVIVGGGVTGLLLAQQLSERGSVLLLSPNLGGLIRSVQRGPYLFDYGGHVYTTKDERVDALMQKCGAQYFDRHAYYVNGDDALDPNNWVEYPVQNNAEELGLDVHAETVDKPRSFYDYSVKMLGRQFTNDFMVPFNERVWQTPMENMDFDWVHGRVKTPGEADKKWGMNARFSYAPGKRIVSLLYAPLMQNKEFRFIRDHVMGIDSDERKVHTKSGQSHEYNQLFLTVSPQYVPECYASTIFVGVPLKTKLDVHFNWLYAKLGSRTHRITLLSRYHEDNAPSDRDTLLLELPVKAPIKLEKVMIMTALHNAGIHLMPSDIDEEHVWFDCKVSYPVPLVGIRNNIATLKLDAREKGIFYAGRWGSHGYFNLQHIFQDVDATVAQLDSRDSRPDYLFSSFYYHK